MNVAWTPETTNDSIQIIQGNELNRIKVLKKEIFVKLG